MRGFYAGMQGVSSLPPESPTANNQQSPTNNVPLPPKPLNLIQPTNRQKKPPMPSPPQSSRMDPEVSTIFMLKLHIFVHVFWGKVNSFCCAVRFFFLNV